MIQGPNQQVQYVQPDGRLTLAGMQLLRQIGGGLPPGGTVGQILVKQSSANGDATWQDIVFSGGGP